MEEMPKENTDLVAQKSNGELSMANGDASHRQTATGPPDGGFRAYSVVVASFLTNGLLFGVINSFGVIFKELQTKLNEEGIENSESKVALIGSLSIGTTFSLSALSGVLTAFLGLRLTAVIGGSIATAGLILSSFAGTNVTALCFTYGIIYGLGASLAYTPSLAILGHYFKRYLGIVNGIVTVGSSIFTIIITTLMSHLIANYGLDWMFRVLASFAFGVALCGLLFKPVPVLKINEPLKNDDSCKALLKTIVNVEIWKVNKYKLWALSMPIALIGYFVPYVHMQKFIEENFAGDNKDLPVQCIAATSAVGRLTFGYLSDKKGINRIFLQQIAFYMIGLLTITLPFAGSYKLLIAISLGMGLFDGAFIALIGPIAVELCGSANAAQAIGYMLGLASIPIVAGPSIAGAIHEHFHSYKWPFVLAGVSPIVGATLMFATRLHKWSLVKKPATTSIRNGHIVANQTDVENPQSTLLTSGDGRNDNQTPL